MLVFVHSLGCNEKHSSCHFNQTKGYWSVPNYSHRFSTETLYCILKDAGCTVSQPTQHNPTKQNWVQPTKFGISIPPGRSGLECETTHTVHIMALGITQQTNSV